MAIWDDVIPADDMKAVERFMENRRERIGGERPALLVIDMSRRFASGEYTAGEAESGARVIRAIKPMLELARSIPIPVLYTTTIPRLTSAQQGQWGPSTPTNGAGDPRSSEIVPDLAPRPDEEVIYKIPPSGFLNTDLLRYLVWYQIDTVIVTGIATSGCIRATAVDAFSHNFTVLIPEECVGDRSVISHKVNLFDLHCKYAEVQPAAKTMEYLGQVRPNPRKIGQPVGAR